MDSRMHSIMIFLSQNDSAKAQGKKKEEITCGAPIVYCKTIT